MWASAPTAKHAGAVAFAEDFRRTATSCRAEQSPAPTKTSANSYCFADFERRADLPQILKRSYSQIWCTVTGGAYYSACRVSMCARNDRKSRSRLNCTRRMYQPHLGTLFSPVFSLAREKTGPPEARRKHKRFAGLRFFKKCSIVYKNNRRRMR